MLIFLISIIVVYFILIGICIGYKYYIHYNPSIEYMSVFTSGSSLNVKQFSSQLSILDPIIRDKLFFKHAAEPYNVSTLSSEELRVQEYTSNQEEKQTTGDIKELELKSLKLTSFSSSSDKNKLIRPKNKIYPQLNLKNILQTDSILNKVAKKIPNAYKRIPVINKKVPTGSKVVNLVLDEPISDYHHSRVFRENFIADMSKLTNVPAERYKIVGVSTGSVDVKFIIIALLNASLTALDQDTATATDETDCLESDKVNCNVGGISIDKSTLSSNKIADLLSVKYTQLVKYKQEEKVVKLLKDNLIEAMRTGDALIVREIETNLEKINSSKSDEDKEIEKTMKLVTTTLTVLDKVSVKPKDMPTIIHSVTANEPVTLIEIIEQVVEVIVAQKLQSENVGIDLSKDLFAALGKILTLQPSVPVQNEQQRNEIKEATRRVKQVETGEIFKKTGSVFTIFPKHRDPTHILGKEYAA
jgi:hypothetical protein